MRSSIHELVGVAKIINRAQGTHTPLICTHDWPYQSCPSGLGHGLPEDDTTIPQHYQGFI